MQRTERIGTDTSGFLLKHRRIDWEKRERVYASLRILEPNWPARELLIRGACAALRSLAGLFPESANAVGDWQADHDHMDEQSLKHVVKFVGASSLKRGERQNDITHYHFNRSPKEKTAHQRVLLQKSQPEARRV